MVSHRIEVSQALISAASAYHKLAGTSEAKGVGSCASDKLWHTRRDDVLYSRQIPKVTWTPPCLCSFVRRTVHGNQNKAYYVYRHAVTSRSRETTVEDLHLSTDAQEHTASDAAWAGENSSLSDRKFPDMTSHVRTTEVRSTRQCQSKSVHRYAVTRSRKIVLSLKNARKCS